jgi:hypothetical protein
MAGLATGTAQQFPKRHRSRLTARLVTCVVLRHLNHANHCRSRLTGLLATLVLQGTRGRAAENRSLCVRALEEALTSPVGGQ